MPPRPTGSRPKKLSAGSRLRRWLSYSGLVLLLLSVAALATAVARSWQAISRQARLERCLLCGAEQRTREIWVLDVRVLRSETRHATAVTRALLKEGQCEHAFYFARERHWTFSLKSNPYVNTRDHNADRGSGIYSDPEFLGALELIRQDNPQRAEYIWARTLRYSFHRDSNALAALETAAQAETASDMVEFLQRSRFFRPPRRTLADIFEATR